MTQRIVCQRLDLLWSHINVLIDNKLIAEHKFYNIKHWHWACRLEGNTDSDDDELVGSDPFTIEEAVERYPKRAVRALFSVLGLEYSRFQEQVLRDQSRREQHTTQVEKRTFEGLATERPSWKKRNSSLGSTIEPLTQRRSSSSLGSTTEPLTEET
jgi:hypothetical protein